MQVSQSNDQNRNDLKKLIITPNNNIPNNIIQNNDNFSHIEWLIISDCIINLNNTQLKCKIQVHNHSLFTADKCTFIPYNDKCEYAIEVFNSKIILTNCKISGAAKESAISVRFNSDAKFTDCEFSKNRDYSLYVTDKSHVDINSCTFQSSKIYSIYLNKNCTAEIRDSVFSSQKGNAIMIYNNSNAKIINCAFDKYKNSCISVSLLSQLYADDCIFNDLGSSSIYAEGNSKAIIWNCGSNSIKGNRVFFNSSTGAVYECTFNDIKYVVIATHGTNSKPVITNSEIINFHQTPICAENHSKPTFYNICFPEIPKYCFRVSLSDLKIEDCTFKNAKEPLAKIKSGEASFSQCTIYDNNEKDEYFTLKINFIHYFSLWFFDFCQESETQLSKDPIFFFQSKFYGLLTNIVQGSDFKTELGQILYLFLNKDVSTDESSEEKFKKIHDFFIKEMYNFDEHNEESKEKMKDLIDQIFNNNFFNFQLVFDLQVCVLDIYVFNCLQGHFMNNNESCSNNEEDKYEIGKYIQLNEMENSQINIKDELYI